MIVAYEKSALISDFASLMLRTDQLLNSEARVSPKKFRDHGGLRLEYDVYEALCESAKGSCFENEIELISGAKFPDIKIGENFGVEVKSTGKNHWTSIGSSILESTRIQNIERIYMTFGKLAAPIHFISKPYEKCLSGIAVTHAPRYTIDMTLDDEENIFSKMGVSYEAFRHSGNPAKIFTDYYRGHLNKGQSLWWIDGDEESNQSSPAITLWNYLSKENQRELMVKSLAFFPEILSSEEPHTKYNRVSLWLARQSIVHNNIRDNYSAGGKYNVMFEGRRLSLPAYFSRIVNYLQEIKIALTLTSKNDLMKYWQLPNVSAESNFEAWLNLIIEGNYKFFQDKEQARRFFAAAEKPNHLNTKFLQ